MNRFGSSEPIFFGTKIGAIEKNIFMKFIISLFAAVLLFSCTSSNIKSSYSKITYEAGACFGFCPVYKLTVNSDRTAIFEAKRFNFSQDTTSDEGEGTFSGKIDEVKYNELISLLNSLDPKNLKDNYGTRNISDLPTSYLSLNFQDGTIKNIEDYGKHGTPKLEKLYHFFDELKTSQNWTKMK